MDFKMPEAPKAPSFDFEMPKMPDVSPRASIKLSPAPAESWPPRHRRDASSTAWRCGLSPLDSAGTAAFSPRKDFREEFSGALDSMIGSRTGSEEGGSLRDAKICAGAADYGYPEVQVVACVEIKLIRPHGRVVAEK